MREGGREGRGRREVEREGGEGARGSEGARGREEGRKGRAGGREEGWAG